MREGPEAAISQAIEKDYIPSDCELTGSEFHYNMFESMITGRDMHDSAIPPNDNFKKIFKAQLIKDFSMAHFVNKLIKEE